MPRIKVETEGFCYAWKELEGRNFQVLCLYVVTDVPEQNTIYV